MNVWLASNCFDFNHQHQNSNIHEASLHGLKCFFLGKLMQNFILTQRVTPIKSTTPIHHLCSNMRFKVLECMRSQKNFHQISTIQNSFSPNIFFSHIFSKLVAIKTKSLSNDRHPCYITKMKIKLMVSGQIYMFFPP